MIGSIIYHLRAVDEVSHESQSRHKTIYAVAKTPSVFDRTLARRLPDKCPCDLITALNNDRYTESVSVIDKPN